MTWEILEEEPPRRCFLCGVENVSIFPRVYEIASDISLCFNCIKNGLIMKKINANAWQRFGLGLARLFPKSVGSPYSKNFEDGFNLLKQMLPDIYDRIYKLKIKDMCRWEGRYFKEYFEDVEP